MSATAQLDIGALLEQAGARPRHNRHDCAKCGGLRTVTHTAECFFCHKCGWKGNAVTLEKELGIYRRIPSAEYRQLRERRALAHEAARRLYAAGKARRFELLEELHSLNRIDAGAHRTGPSDAAWNALALVYGERPAIESELDCLESASAAEVWRLCGGVPNERGHVH